MRRLFALAALAALCGAGFAVEEDAVEVMNKKCAGNLKEYCAEINTPFEKALCLSKKHKGLTAECAAALDQFFPCGQAVADNCAKEPKEKMVMCLLKNHKKLDGKCLARLDTLVPCGVEYEKFCGGSGDNGNPVCLFDNISKVSPTCLTAIKQQFPCYAETVKFCRAKQTPSQVYDCLSDNIDKLSGECVKRRLPCAKDERKLCSAEKTPFAKERCLKANAAKLGDTCSAAVASDEKKRKMLTAYICSESIAKYCKEEGQKGDMEKVASCLEKNKENLTGQCKVVAIFSPACEADLDTHCANLGDKEKTACVHKNEAKFSPKCKDALKLLRADPNWKE